MKRPLPLAPAATLAFWLAAAATPQAQIAIQILPAEEAAEEKAADSEENAEQPVAAESTPEENTPPEESKTPQQILAEALPKMKFDRSPEALLAAIRASRENETAGPAEAFEMAVIFGDWAEVGRILATLPETDARNGYSRLLATLAEKAVGVNEVLKTPSNPSPDEDPFSRNQRLQNERNQANKKAAPLLSEDFYGLVNASPGDLREEDIPNLAALARTAIGDAGRSTLLSRIQDGWKGLGGTSEDGRKLATRLLSALGWILDAAPFLPLDPESWENADSTQLVFALEFFTQSGIRQRDERQLARAAELCSWLMKTARFGNYTRPQFRLAMDRLVQLLPALDRQQALTLIREQLFTQTATLTDLINVIGELGRSAADGKDLQARAASLGTQNLLLEALVTKEGELPPNAALLVLNWLGEAEGCYRAGGVSATERTQAELMLLRRYGMGRQGEVTTLSTEQILATAPPLELLPRLNPGLAQRVRLTRLKVGILQPDEPDLAELRSYLETHPGLEREVCQDVLAGWVAKRTKPSESEEVKQMRAYGMYIPPNMLPQGDGIPLTRLRQNQNIRHFQSLLGELRSLSPEPLDPALIVQAFMTLHSGAEVYKLDDILTIFGPPEDMVPAELLSLLGGMRGRLSEQWRDPSAQQDAATNRTEQEIKDEVSAGYRTALTLADRGIQQGKADWNAFTTRGQLFFDASQYEFERGIQLTEYVSLRDEAFASFRKAAEIYAASVPNLPRGQWTADPYQAWFFVMLGASDLAQLTSNPARSDPGLRGIGEAMLALPGEAPAWHTEAFAKMLGEVFPRVPPNVRQRFLQSGLAVIGEDHPAAAEASKPLAYYRELLDEVQLRLTLDGPTEIGHTTPFGAFLGIECTRQLLRESGGFAKYLQNQADQRQAMYGGMGGSAPGMRNLREDFTKNIHAALEETFEILSITFHDANVRTIDLPREGWVETPLAYMVLRARNAAVDRIPSIQIDMDFKDQPGQVVLPVLSQVQPVDASQPETPPRPCNNLALDVVLDEREWQENRLVVEITARGEGILPDLDALFDWQREGFETAVNDSGMLVTQFVSEGGVRKPMADRNWQITYTRRADSPAPTRFALPAARPEITATSLGYKHYDGPDIVELSAAAAARGVKLPGTTSHNARLWILAGTAALLVLWFLSRLLRRKPDSAGSSPLSRLEPPAEATPFTTVAYLRRLRQEMADRLNPADQTAIREQIDAIQAAYFGKTPPQNLNLPAILAEWSATARKRT
jgi:hypothetical protein